MHTMDKPTSPRSRRGVLLLVVLSMLTLFLMLGATYLVTATRARETARAYARLTFGGDEARIPHARLADMVLLKILRGGTGSLPIPLVAASSFRFESLLADKYGSGTAPSSSTRTIPALVSVTAPTAVAATPSPVLTVSATLVDVSAHPTDLNGRLLTFLEPGRPASTHRILRARVQGSDPNANAAGSAFTLSVEGPRRVGPWTRPAGGRAIINGREYSGMPAALGPLTQTNESWDGFDEHNPFLAQVLGTTIASSTVARISFYPGLVSNALTTALQGVTNLIPDGADNDNDGTLDGLFLDFGIPPAIDGHGNQVDLDASVLIVDLDGRFNVNAHGSLAPIIYSGSHSGWSEAAEISGTLVSIPMGSGYGAAEIQANLGTRNEPQSGTAAGGFPRLFDQAALQTGSNENPRASLTVGNQNSPGSRPPGSRYSQGVATTQVGNLEGKYGERGATALTASMSNGLNLDDSDLRFARPGQPRVDDAVSRIADRRSLPPTTGGSSDVVNYGVPPIWWTGAANFNWGVSDTVAGVRQPLPRGVYNAPPDLHGRMKTLTLSASGAAIVPQVAYAQPEWSSATLPRETKDDPYELRVDTRLGFGGLLHDPNTDGTVTGALVHNPYTPAELEPVLRPYDIDTNRLPPRLTAILGSAVEESRLKITTDSWDTTAITGSAAIVLFGTSIGGSDGWLQAISGTLYGAGPNAAVAGAIGGEVSRGEKFDLNRPLAASEFENRSYRPTSEYVVQRQAYFKDLYTLLVALAPTLSGSALAQWAANVVEFRDADSRVIPLEYDENPGNGWQDSDGSVTTSNSDRKVVWGAERPEILIREAFAWRNTQTGSAGMAIALHRPWKATAYADLQKRIDAEPCDGAIDTFVSGVPQNRVDLGKKANPAVLSPGGPAASVTDDVSQGTYPIWRLRLVAGGATTYVRLDSGSAGANECVLTPAIANGSDKPKLAPDTTLTLVSGTQIAMGFGSTSGTALLELSQSGTSRTVAGMQMPGTAMSGTVYLERLSDPSGVPTNAQWMADPTANADTATDPLRYIVVDETSLTVVDTATPSANAVSHMRTTTHPTEAFWRPPGPGGSLGTIVNGVALPFPSPLVSGSTAWLPWPNRPFVSSAELMLVPQGNAVEMLRSYRRLTPAESGTSGLGFGAPVPLGLLFDAIHVPTRFAGIHGTTGATAAGDLSPYGIFSGTATAPRLSSWREPGRVNLNTVVTEDVWNAVVGGPLAQPLRSSTSADLRTTPARFLATLLGLQAISSTSGTAPVPLADTAAGLAANLNPLHGIYTATRLANTTTTRSNVFAIWITLRESVAGDPDSVRYRRAFYIVDRSIPVGFEDGRDHNVWDCVRVRRIIE